jgi:hypothetical protein
LDTLNVWYTLTEPFLGGGSIGLRATVLLSFMLRPSGAVIEVTTVCGSSPRSGRQYVGSSVPGIEAFAVNVHRAYFLVVFRSGVRWSLYEEPPSRNQRNKGRRVMRLPAMIARPVSTTDQMAIW